MLSVIRDINFSITKYRNFLAGLTPSVKAHPCAVKTTRVSFDFEMNFAIRPTVPALEECKWITSGLIFENNCANTLTAKISCLKSIGPTKCSRIITLTLASSCSIIGP
ncbi:Uncharacterised protein [Staphylococcus aureus]|nr:Uncharacterised protein [Staphylococcus aureus]